MNNNGYKRTFSQIRPSEQTIERIFEMSEKKNRRIRHRGLIVAAVCLMALLCGTLTANAATDGALFEGINLIVNGEDVNIVDYIKSHDKYVTDDGTIVETYEFEFDDGNSQILVESEADIDSDIDLEIKEEADDGTVIYNITE